MNPKGAVAVLGIRLAATVQVILGLLCPGQGPFLLVPPSIVPHNEYPHGGFFDDPILAAVQPVVEPAQVDSVYVDGHRVGHYPKVMAAGHAGAAGRVLPGADDQSLATTRGLVSAGFLHAKVVSYRATQEDVVPTTHVQCRDIDLGVMIFDA